MYRALHVVPIALSLLSCSPAPPARKPVAPASASGVAAASSVAPTSAAPAASGSGSAAVIRPRPPQAPNVEALKTAFSAKGYKVQVQTQDERVLLINFLGQVPTAKRPLELFSAMMKAHGDLLGYGPLGEVELGESELGGPLGSIVGNFPKAAGCPQLRFVASFNELVPPNRTPFWWIFGCPASEGELGAFMRHRVRIQEFSLERRSHPELTDPFAVWLRSEGFTADKLSRTPDGVEASLINAKPLAGDRVAGAKAIAERAATAEGLPSLDTVDLAPPQNVTLTPEELKTGFTTLTLRLAKPPLDGACIDPRVEVDVSDAKPPTRIGGVKIECAREPTEGSKAPPDAGRALPRAATGSLPFVAVCESINFAWGYQHLGEVVDKRGDVYSFSGGRPFSGHSAQELGVLIRHGKHFEGTLPPGDVDRLVSLAAQVAGEPFVTRQVKVYDAAGGHCGILRAGTSPDAIVLIPFDRTGTTESKRAGPASAEAARVLAKFHALKRP